MQRGPLEKRSIESVLYDVGCSKLLGEGVTIVSIGAIQITPATSPALTSTAAVISAFDAVVDGLDVPAGQAFSVRVGGGQSPANGAGQLYYLRVPLTTSRSDLIEATVPIRVNDYPVV